MSTTDGLGLYRGPNAIPDRLEPGQPPQPSEGYQGPPLAQPLLGWDKWLEKIDKLGEQIAKLGFDAVANTATGTTDSSGNATIGLYQIAAGVEARMHRLIVNASNPSTGLAYTPAVPYTNASTCYLILGYSDAYNVNPGDGAWLDFAPPTATGPVFPALFTDNSQQAAFVRGPAWFVLRVASGPASTSVFARYQISLRRMQGVA